MEEPWKLEELEPTDQLDRRVRRRMRMFTKGAPRQAAPFLPFERAVYAVVLAVYALYTGALQAVCGAIELARARLPYEGAPAVCYLAGGAASELAPHLTAPVELVDNLVLEGVLVLAEA